MFFARRRLARPEKASETVLLAARDDMHVQVRHALAHAIVNGDEGAFGPHAPLDGARQQLDILEKWADQVGREILQCLIVRFRDEQRVAGEHVPIVQKR